MTGKFIVFEGIDGAGKSTHLDFTCAQIRALKGVDVVLTREPGGTPLAEKIRELVLHEPMDVETEVLMVAAARRDHVTRVIAPALAAGKWVVCDRYVDSTRAYQGGGGGVPLDWIDQLMASATKGIWPDRVYLFDAPAALAAARRNSRGNASDRFEAQDLQYFERVRDVYLNKPRVNSQAPVVIDSSQDVSRIQSIIKESLLSL
jgi:dTMP kinase